MADEVQSKSFMLFTLLLLLYVWYLNGGISSCSSDVQTVLSKGELIIEMIIVYYVLRFLGTFIRKILYFLWF